MLTLISSQQVQLACPRYLFSYGTRSRDGKLSVFQPLPVITPTHRPYSFSNKPLATGKNFVGNRSVDHVNYDGFILTGPGVEVTNYDPYLYRFNWSFGSLSGFSALIGPQSRLRSRFATMEGTIPSMTQWGTYGVSGRFFAYAFSSYTANSVVYAHFTLMQWRVDGAYFLYDTHRHKFQTRWPAETSMDELFAYLRDYSLSYEPRWEKWAGRISPDYDPHFGFKSSELHHMKHSLRDWAKSFVPLQTDDPLIGEATMKAADSCKYFQGNTATYLNELIHLRESLADVKKLMKGDVTLKSLSSLYLQQKYGLRLTLLDTIELGKGLARYFAEDHSPRLFSIARGRETSRETGVSAGCKLYYDPDNANGLAKVVKGLMDWDLFPTFVNVWDVIPYSFVVDWFTGVEGFLHAHDTHTYLSVLNIFSCCYTLKTEARVNFPGWTYGAQGSSIRISRFLRWNPKRAVEPTPTFSGSLSSDNVITGAALIIQTR